MDNNIKTPESDFPKHFDSTSLEQAVMERWMAADAFAALPDERTDTYVIMMPLPNVTGALHMGHAMDNVMQDLLTRWHRMRGDNTLWMPGTDHAGIATQAVVEKRLLELEGKTRHDIGREALVEKIWAWKDEYKQRIVQQQQSMGCSCDWKRQRFTMDAVCTRAVHEAFFRLFRDGLIYRGDRLVNWDCQLQTAVSDDEIVYEKVRGHFWHIRYPVIDPRPGEPKSVTVATTRPETMLGDTAVAVHPDPEEEMNRQIEAMPAKIAAAPKKDRTDLEEEWVRLKDRQKNLLPVLLKLKKMAEEGRTIRLPLLDREIPLILDLWAKPELGSGCVKITPAHDPNDYDVWNRNRNRIGIINILQPDGTLNTNAGPYAGLDRFAARDRVIADIEGLGLLEETEDRDIEVGHSDRSKTLIEPYLSKQWFVNMGDIEGGILCSAGTDKQFHTPGLAQAAMDGIDREWASPSGRRLTFAPDHRRYGGTYFNWLAEKRDWCISRQLWWGHRIPIWHGTFTLDLLKEKAAALPSSPGSSMWAWVTDTEGHLTGINNIGSLDESLSYSLLVCLRDKQSEDKFGGELEALGLARDPDVLDTWFSSALWPFSTLGWPDPETAEVEEGQRPLGKNGFPSDCLSYYYPGSCLVTGRDIITLWVARMMVMGLYLLGDVPFTDCFVHANIQDGKGERMSKSTGNGIDPVDIIERYGTDAMRYVLCEMQTGTQDIRLPVQAVSPFTGNTIDLATAKHGRTIFTYICPETNREFDVLGTMPDLPVGKIISERFEVGRAFCTKLWNAARFALMNLGRHESIPLSSADLRPEDHWILSRLSRIVRRVTEQLEAYNPSAAIGTAREFFWSEFCDWYLEFIKPRFKNDASAPAARTVLSYVLDRVLRLLHPFVPYITEVLWKRLNDQCPARGLEKISRAPDLLITASWPQPDKSLEDKAIEEDFGLIKNAVGAVRELRARSNIPPSKNVTALIKADNPSAGILNRYQNLLLHMGGISALMIAPDIERPATAATTVVGDCEIYLEGLIDPDMEKTRLTKQRDKLLMELERAESRLKNPHFVDRAPPEVVEKEKAKLTDIQGEISLIEENLAHLNRE
ncbi:MAG: valine--tRNA ligase [Acidobacteriota bacterium]